MKLIQMANLIVQLASVNFRISVAETNQDIIGNNNDAISGCGEVNSKQPTRFRWEAVYMFILC